MTRFLSKLALLVSPFFAAFMAYCIFDPFRVLRTYETYYESGSSFGIFINRDFVSTQHWLNHHAKRPYDSYIFGGSSSGFFEADTWAEHIGVPRANVYHFDGSDDGIYGIEKKIALIASSGRPLKNVLITFKNTTLRHVSNPSGHLYIKHPALSEQSWLTFHSKFFRAFMDLKFLKDFAAYKISGEIPLSAQNNLRLDPRVAYYDASSNELSLAIEDSIRKDSIKYYQSTDVFFSRDSLTRYAAREIHSQQLSLLKKMAEILRKKGTSYKIVLVPTYDQVKLDTTDLRQLQEVFGADNVFDFTGINEFSASKYDYYETVHFRPHIAARLMDSIYSLKPEIH